jgi:hypothetical protein
MNSSKVYVYLLEFNVRHTMTTCRILRELQMQGLIAPYDVTGKLDYGSYPAISSCKSCVLYKVVLIGNMEKVVVSVFISGFKTDHQKMRS